MIRYFFFMIAGVLFGFVLIFIPSCKKKYSCDAEKLIVTISSSVISEALNCQNPIALEPYIKKLTSKLMPCNNSFLSTMPKGEICKQAISDVLQNGLSSLPKEAECDGGIAYDLIESEAIEWCEDLFDGIQ